MEIVVLQLGVRAGTNVFQGTVRGLSSWAGSLQQVRPLAEEEEADVIGVQVYLTGENG